MNDTYVEQVVASAKAAIETLDAKGVIDPKRVGVGGHSYGRHDGQPAGPLGPLRRRNREVRAYNRTLTPFGSRASVGRLEAPELYMKMSPFTYANKINEPILLITARPITTRGLSRSSPSASSRP